ncbi:GNAT family N-acetyltransferase [Schleiferilactobacillus harbinensis]|uniref:GNAT family N-acetyltransferase n=1 Tax=Schleiferilactobacillus harbinensis TaxID=304207 RepID=UPI0030B88D09
MLNPAFRKTYKEGTIVHFIEEPGRFFTNDLQGDLMAELTYQPSEDGKVWVIDHTFVRGDQRGKGIAKELLDTAVQAARDRSIKVKPLCTYARTQFMKHPEAYADVKA